jgi:hypothetical protein
VSTSAQHLPLHHNHAGFLPWQYSSDWLKVTVWLLVSLTALSRLPESIHLTICFPDSISWQFSPDCLKASCWILVQHISSVACINSILPDNISLTVALTEYRVCHMAIISWQSVLLLTQSSNQAGPLPHQAGLTVKRMMKQNIKKHVDDVFNVM